MYILITGGCGYIWKILTARLLASGCYVDVIDITPDINSQHPRYHYIRSDIADFIEIDGSMYDLVVHLAAEKNVSKCEDNPTDSYRVNVVGTKNLVDFCTMYDIHKIVFASTAWVYWASSVSVDEKDNTDPTNIYSRHKLESESILKQWSQKSSKNTVSILRFFNVVWVDAEFHLDEDPISGENLFCLVLRHLMGIDNWLFSIHTFSDGETPYRDFVNVKDIIKAIIILIQDSDAIWCDVFNISTWVSSSIDEVIDTFEYVSNQKLSKQHIQAPEYVVPMSQCVPTKFYQKYWFRPSISLRDSITETIQYYNL